MKAVPAALIAIVAAVIGGVLVFASQAVAGVEGECEHIGVLDDGRELYACSAATPTPTPPTDTPTSTPEAPTPTATATPSPSSTNTPTPSPTPSPTPTTAAMQLPQKSGDGTYYITTPGTYTGNAVCDTISPTQHCVHLWNSAVGITFVDFTVVSSGYGIQVDHKSVVRNGSIESVSAGIDGWQKTNVVIDGNTITSRNTAFVAFSDGGCESLTTKRNRDILITGNTFHNSGSEVAGDIEGVYLKCAQDVTIEGNTFLAGPNSWFVSTPDGIGITVSGNSFDLGDAKTWAAIELPKVAGVTVEENAVTGGESDQFLYINSGTTGVEVRNNCIQPPVVFGDAQGVTVNENNGECVTPPATGSGGLR